MFVWVNFEKHSILKQYYKIKLIQKYGQKIEDEDTCIKHLDYKKNKSKFLLNR